MKVIEIAASVKEHKSQCVSEFVTRWLSGQVPGTNVPYMARTKKFKSPKALTPQQEITPKLIAQTVQKGLLYVNQKRVPHLPYPLKGKSKILLAFENSNLGLIENSFTLSKKHILYEDKELVAIDKPHGLPSQSTFHLYEDHAKSLLYEYYLKSLKGLKAPYLALCHRLDRDTSGVLILTKKQTANKGMAELFGQHKMHKSYFALVKETEGQSLPKKFSVKGLITKTPTAKHPFYFSMHATQGQFSETQFQVLQKGQDLTLLQCFPLTGRSHQIRVHLKHYGVPILGDPFYGRGAKEFSRLALHSHSLKFKHPLSKADLEILSPLPSSFSDALNDASS